MEVPPCGSVTSRETLVSVNLSQLAVGYLVPVLAGVSQYCGLNVRAWGMEVFYKTNRSALVGLRANQREYC